MRRLHAIWPTRVSARRVGKHCWEHTRQHTNADYIVFRSFGWNHQAQELRKHRRPQRMRFLIFARCPWSCRCAMNGPGPNCPPTLLAANIFRCCLQTDCSVNPIPVSITWVTSKPIPWNLVLTLRLCSYSRPSRRSMTNFGIGGDLDESLRWNSPTNGPMGIDMLLAALALRFRLWRPGRAINFTRIYRCVKKCWVMPTAAELCVACQRDRIESMSDPNIAHVCKSISNGILQGYPAQCGR